MPLRSFFFLITFPPVAGNRQHINPVVHSGGNGQLYDQLFRAAIKLSGRLTKCNKRFYHNTQSSAGDNSTADNKVVFCLCKKIDDKRSVFHNTLKAVIDISGFCNLVGICFNCGNLFEACHIYYSIRMLRINLSLFLCLLLLLLTEHLPPLLRGYPHRYAVSALQ